MRIFLSILLALIPALAWAGGGGHAGGAEDADQQIILLLTLLGLVSGAYLMTHFVVGRLQKQLLFVSGAEYIVLGYLLGPQTGVLDNLGSLAPVVAFAAGWIGILCGMELNIRELLQRPDRSTRLAIVDSLFTGGAVSAVAYIGFTELMGISAAEAGLTAGVMGCAAAAGASSAVDLLMEQYGDAGNGLLALLQRASNLSDVIAIVAFGVLFCVYHSGGGGSDGMPDASDWLLIMVGLGTILGVLFVLFLGRDASENNRFLTLVGIIAFASGAAYFLRLSVLAVNLFLGAVLVNTGPGREIFRTLSRTAKPVALVLLIFAGVRFEPIPILAGLVVSVGYIALRWLCKIIGGWMAAAGSDMRSDVYRGMLAQGSVSVAMALSLRLFYEGESVDLAYCAILISVMFNELISARTLRGLLVDAGDVRQDMALAEGGH